MGQRRPLVAGNWKMFTDRAGAVRLAREVAEDATSLATLIDLAVCPPFVYLDAVGAALRERGSPVALGAQDVYFEREGAFTGEISAQMLRDLGVRAVIVGHSERRHIMAESDALIARKTRAALDADLVCILCVGETLDQRERGEADAVNERQTRAALAGIPASATDRLIVAYEPVWAIGTGRTASPDDAQAAHASIRAVLGSHFDADTAARTRILYGGSVKPDNARSLFAQPDIDGGLIGGASLKSPDFLSIARAAADCA